MQNAKVLSFEFLVCNWNLKSKIQNSKFKIQNWTGGLLALVGLVVAGCGYGFSAKGEAFPKDVQKVFVETLVNRTREVGVEGEVTAALKNELAEKEASLRQKDLAMKHTEESLTGLEESLVNQIRILEDQLEQMVQNAGPEATEPGKKRKASRKSPKQGSKNAEPV